MSRISILILTYNEELNLPVCLASLQGLEADIFIIDSGSADKTVEIAKSYGCHVYTHKFESHAEQVNWSLDRLPIKTPWVMRLDADERLTDELREEIEALLVADNPDVQGYQVKRRVYFWGQWIRFGGYYPTWLLRIWRNGSARSEQRWMDEHMVLTSGKAACLSYDIIDENHKGLSFWTHKHNQYADKEVQDLLGEESAKDTMRLSGQAMRKRWLKQNWYKKMPLFFRAFLYWFYRYFFLLGFLDGRSGLVFHFLQGFWYRFLVDAKLFELKRKARSEKS